MSYTLPNGRKATPKQERERTALLEARRTCPECIRLAREAVRRSDYRFGVCQCDEHRS